MEIIENKGSKKRYKLRVKKEQGFFKKLFGWEDEHYHIVVLSTKEIEVEDLPGLSQKVLDDQDNWKESKTSKKSSDYTHVLSSYQHITFFIYKISQEDATNKTSQEADKEQ